MKRFFFLWIVFLPFIVFAQHLTKEDYTKTEKYITMRDGVKLYTVIYKPKDLTQDYPILMRRTPYGCKPYGKNKWGKEIIYNDFLVQSGYIFVIQDMRGRYMSEGQFENVKPIYHLENPDKTDETTDTWDTVDWLVKNEANNNGNVGVLGNSYLGWTALQAAISQHPAIKAVEAASPVTDFYFEDFQRYGLLCLGYLPVYDLFGVKKVGYKTDNWWKYSASFYGDSTRKTQVDYYDYFLKMGPLKNVDNYVRSDNYFWKELKAHPNYDDFHKKRSILSHLKDINCNMMIVGGWHDEQNLFGIINAYNAIEKNNPDIENSWVMGPWAHGHQKTKQSEYYLGDIFLGEDISKNFQKEIELDYFEHHLKGKKRKHNFEKRLFNTADLKWYEMDNYYPVRQTPLYFSNNYSLTPQPSSDPDLCFEYISDPSKPVPQIEEDNFYFIPPKFAMTDDQRFASKRPDVLTFETASLADPVTLLGKIEAQLVFSTTQTDADLIVKIIDVYPMDRLPDSTDIEGAKMNGYQRLIRTGYIRGRYRKGFEKPVSMIANARTSIHVDLLDVFHTFKAGHKIMVQIQSSQFPMFDRNPQKYIENIIEADAQDYVKATHKIYSSSRIILPVVTKK